MIFSKKSLLLFVLVFIFKVFGTKSQTSNPHESFWQHVRFGGGIGLSFGNGFFSGTLAPSAIYEFTPEFAMGVGLNGTFNSLKNSYTSTIVGGSLLGLWNAIPELQLSVEFEELYVSRNYDDLLLLKSEDYWYPALFVGAGYHNGPITFGIRYDLLFDSDKSIYAEAWMPFFRIYF